MNGVRVPGTLVTVLQPNLILGSYREAIDDIFSGLIFPVTRICQWLPTSKRFGCQRPSLRSGDISLAFRRRLILSFLCELTV